MASMTCHKIIFDDAASSRKLLRSSGLPAACLVF
jgi:hypothetical protein